MRRLLPLPILALVLLAAGCGDDGGGSTSTATTNGEPVVTDAADAGCRTVEAPAPKQVDESRPTERLDPDATYVVTLATSCGDIEIELDQGRQPKTAASFASLVGNRVFDGLTFHRVVPGFVIQGGDPAGNGSGGPGYEVRERPPRDAQYTRGVVAMAKTELDPAGTSGSQFFIVTGEDAGLPADYAIVGKVVGGEDTVDRIAAVPTGATDEPQSPVVIESATLSER